MSMSAALGSAVSGLKANSTSSDIIARNISNASTEGYTKKLVKLETVDGTVRVSSIDRQVSGLLDRLDRQNVAQLSRQSTIADGISAYTDYLGQPEDDVSPVALLSDLKSMLVGLTGAPAEGASQIAVVSAAKEFANQMNVLASTVASVEAEVELNIRYDVSDLNSALYQVSKINSVLSSTPPGSVQAAELQDDLGLVLDSISGLMDVQTVTNSQGQVSIYTSGGAELLTGNKVKDVSYDSTTGTLRAGTVDITPGSGSRSFSEGSLGGLFELKNTNLPAINDQLDALSAATIEGFERVAPISPDGRGLFTDAGGAYDATNVAGLASRIEINPDVDPDQGGLTSLLQNGGDATVEIGNNDLALAMVAIFDDAVAVPTAGMSGGDSLTKLASVLTSGHQQIRVNAENSAATIESSQATISASRQNLQGVNIDDEMQKLILVEQSYAANAKVLTAVNSMLDTLLDAF